MNQETVAFAALLERLASAGPEDPERFVGCFTADALYDDVFLGVHSGHEGLRRLLAAIDRDGRDYRWQFFDPVALGDRGYARYLLSYTSRMPDSAGRRVALEGVSIVRLRDGLISEYHEVADAGTALAMLGYAPERLARILGRRAQGLQQKRGLAGPADTTPPG